MKVFVHRADQLMYQGKKTGKTGFVPSHSFKHGSKDKPPSAANLDRDTPNDDRSIQRPHSGLLR